MILRAIAIVTGLALLAATAHVTVLATTGYQNPHAILVLAIAGGVGIGALCTGVAWSEKRCALAVLIALTLVAGELFGLIQTGERLIAVREAAQAPARYAAEARRSAHDGVKEAEAALAALTSSPRLKTALTAKDTAHRAVIDKSALRGCASNCRRLLEASVAAAGREVAEARGALDAQRAKSLAQLTTARAALRSVKTPATATALADRLGLPAWALDLITAALGSIAANGLGCGLLAFGGHRPPQRIAVELPSQHGLGSAMVPALIDNTSPTRVADAHQHIADFARSCMVVDPNAKIPIAHLHAAYVPWCDECNVDPLAPMRFGALLAELFEHTRTPVESLNSEPVAVGIKVVPSPQGKIAA